LAVLGVLNPGVSYALGLAGLARITASATTLLWATEPIMILLMAWAILRQRPTATIVGCAGVALVGVLLVVAAPDVGLDPLGVVLMLAGVAACAIYTVLSGRYVGSASTLGVILLQQLAALAFALALFAAGTVAGRAGDLGEVSVTGWASALVAGALYYGVAFWFWLQGLRTCSPGAAGLFINLVPVFGVAAAALLLDERLVGRQWLGAVLVIGAVAVMAAVQSRQEETSTTQYDLATSRRD
jgi:drug/metabolite transporter (DMT)-like permease